MLILVVTKYRNFDQSLKLIKYIDTENFFILLITLF